MNNLPEGDLEVLKIAKKYGHEIVFLPPYHPQLNPIERAWALTKNYVALNNLNASFSNLKGLIFYGFNKITPNIWERLTK